MENNVLLINNITAAKYALSKLKTWTEFYQKLLIDYEKELGKFILVNF